MADGKFQSVEVLDPYRIKFTFTPGTPFRDMPAQAGGTTIFSKAHYEANKRDLEKSSLEPFLGTGAYVLESFKPGQQVDLQAGPGLLGRDASAEHRPEQL